MSINAIPNPVAMNAKTALIDCAIVTRLDRAFSASAIFKNDKFLYFILNTVRSAVLIHQFE